MTIERVRVANFQSIEDLDLELDPRLTVLVGPSNSGKSALLRAIGLVARNSHKSDFVTTGKPHARVSLGLSEGVDVAIERGPGLSQYFVSNDDGTAEYPKSGSNAPDDVAALIGFGEIDGQSINTTTQFDAPFLLDWPASRVATALGTLSGADVIYEAVRESERRRKERTRTLSTRESDLQALDEQLERFEGLDERVEAIDEAEELLAKTHKVVKARRTVRQLVDACNTSAKRLDEASDRVADVTPPDLSKARKVVGGWQRVAGLVSTCAAAVDRLDDKAARLRELADELDRAKQARHDVLTEMGTCPTCGQEIA